MSSGTGREFMERTRYRYLGVSDQMKGLSQPPLELPCEIDGDTIELPEPGAWEIVPVTLYEALTMRRSVRNFSKSPLTLKEFSYLLWSSQGVKETVDDAATFRTVPSAGARHALETYLLVNRVEGLAPGIYRFLAVDHRLAPLWIDSDVTSVVSRACLGQEMIAECAVAFIWTAVPYRMTWRYGERGYRYLFLDAGHACQNLYLSAEAVECGVCAVAAFDDDAMNDVLDIDGVEQFALYLAVVGRKV